MTPDRINHLETQVDNLTTKLHNMHIDILKEIGTSVDSALDRHIAHCPMGPKIEALNSALGRHEDINCPLTPRVEALEARPPGGKSVWDKLGPWAVIVAGFSLGALVVSGVLSPAVLSALIPF